METWTLTATATDGSPLEATFAPDHGMTLLSYKKGSIEVMATSTRADFEARSAGVGVVIGPHFHRRDPAVIPPVPHEDRFPHIAQARAKGSQEPFSHGIARYAPWRAQKTDQRITAHLSGDDTWHDVPLHELEGQMFAMAYTVELKSDGLHFDLNIESEDPSLVGFHFYYDLPQGKGVIHADVQPQHRTNEAGWVLIPQDWSYDSHHLTYPLDRETDFGFRPFPGPDHGAIRLETATHQLEVHYTSQNPEHAWQLWHPEDASFVCIEPMSSHTPRHPTLKESGLTMNVAIQLPVRISH